MDGRIIPAYAGSTAGDGGADEGGGDHPRIRGEHTSGATKGRKRHGSSPHTRGARPIRGHPPLRRRIIPAYAGSTYLPKEADIFEGDHPRIRGEHSIGTLCVPKAIGSSPHTRGAQRRILDCEKRHRIIPAYAGSTACGNRCHALSRDHPRIRGEHKPDQIGHLSIQGSSPHTRGALHVACRAISRGGIIPAYAGSTAIATATESVLRDHPRIRGEHLTVVVNASFGLGSSPHTRGAQNKRITANRHSRIIPAYAGSTRIGVVRSFPRGDHPRIRGEHAWDANAAIPALGSSPHTRGALVVAAVILVTSRIIPAYAGSTIISCSRFVPAMDHPRIRGEHVAYPEL